MTDRTDCAADNAAAVLERQLSLTICARGRYVSIVLLRLIGYNLAAAPNVYHKIYLTQEGG